MSSSYQRYKSESNRSEYLTIHPLITIFVRIFLFFFFLGFIVVLFAQWVPTITGVGQLIALNPENRVQDIGSPIEGRVKEWFVMEGEAVTKGQLLAQIADIDPKRLSRLKNQLKAAKEKLEIISQSEIRQARHVERVKELYSSGIESKRSFELAEIDFFKISTEKNQVKILIEEINSEISRQSAQKVIAPNNGVITNIYTPSESQVIKSGHVLARIVPKDTNPAAEILVSGRDLPLVSKGQVARLVFEGWPSVQVMGWPSLAVGTFEGRVQIIDQGDDGMGSFRVVVVPPVANSWPEAGMGSKVKVWIQLKSVPIWWEIWRRFSGVPPSV